MFDAEILGEAAVTESVAVAPFDDSTAPYELAYDQTSLTVTLRATSAIDYQVFMTSSGGTEQSVAWSGNSLALGAETDLTFSMGSGAHWVSLFRASHLLF